MAIFFPKAFPPMVSAAIVAVTINEVITGSSANDFAMFDAIKTLNDPEITPQMSPMTSLQNDPTLSAFRLKVTATLAPLTFLALME